MPSPSSTKSTSILIDEARTPLIISGPLDDRADLYNAVDKLIPLLTAEDFELDEKQRQVSLTETGNERMEKMLAEAGLCVTGSLYDIENVTLVHHVNQALKAHKLFQRDKDYIVKAGEVIIIDEFTGRMMPGRRYSEGLHQALEAKEHVEIQPENQTLASITFQNYFRLYEKLAGMTGTALTEAQRIHATSTVSRSSRFRPTSPVRVSTKTTRSTGRRRKSYDAIVTTIADCYREGSRRLVGTTSIEKSEQLSALLKDKTYILGLSRSLKAQAEKLKDAKEGKSSPESELKAYLNDIGDYLADPRIQKGGAIPFPIRC